jgi:hypothetical protein
MEFGPQTAQFSANARTRPTAEKASAEIEA